MKRFKLWSKNIALLASILPLIQIAAIFIFHNQTCFLILQYVGWDILPIATVFLFIPVYKLEKEGKVKKEKFDTTILIESGVYSVIRHPQLLAFNFIHLALILISQHWIIDFIGVVSIMINYLIAIQEDKKLVQKFGDVYVYYMQRVPRMNFIVGIIRLLKYRYSQ